MSNVSIDSWNDFMFQVGQDFYDFIHGKSESNDQFTMVQYPYTISYDGVFFIEADGASSRHVPCIGSFVLENQNAAILRTTQMCLDSNLNTFESNYHIQPVSVDFTWDAPNSYISYNNPYWISTNNTVYMKDYSQNWQYTIFRANVSITTFASNINQYYDVTKTKSNSQIVLNSYNCKLIRGYNGYDYYFDGDSSRIPVLYSERQVAFGYTAPAPLTSSPIIYNSSNFNVSNSFTTDIKNTYINNGDTITNYTYNIDNDNYITVNYSVDGDGVPTGYIDVNPTGNISFDDLFDMFNTILAPLVGVGLDLPDWTDYQPPVVTGDINVNIDLPDVTGVYPAETITPIESDVYNIMSIDSMPQLPSLTGIDNGESAAALGSSFTFLDGCGLLMPFVTIAIIRLLISKFRGDS